MKQIGLRWPEDLLKRIDKARGGETRAAYIRGAVKAAIEGRVRPEPIPPAPTVAEKPPSDCPHKLAFRLRHPNGRQFCSRCRTVIE